jgi:lysophospholipase L1-like esterase
MLREYNIRLVLYSAPYYSYTKMVDKNILQKHTKTMNDLQKKYGIEFYNFTADPKLYNNPRLFTDPLHLNTTGGRLFSAKLKNAMVQYELGTN